MYEGRAVDIEAVLGFDTAQIKDLVTGKSLEVKIPQLWPRKKEADSEISCRDSDLTEELRWS
jgi:hypothetical protein